MPTLLDDLHAALTDVLIKHGRLEIRDRLYRVLAERITEPVDQRAFLARVCQLFNAAPVTA